MSRFLSVALLLLVVVMVLSRGSSAATTGLGPIKVGVLHSLTGTLALSETVLKDGMLMHIAHLNANGGLLGRQVQAVVKDPASDWVRFAELAQSLIVDDGVVSIFGCWTSVGRKSVLPVVESLNSLLWYSVQYEGEELSKNIFYTGALPGQQAIPAVDWLLSVDGGSKRRFILCGTSYVYPRVTNEILVEYLHSKGIADADILVRWTPFGHTDWTLLVAEFREFAVGGSTAIISTVNGDANLGLYAELAAQGVQASSIPMVAFSVGEQEMASLPDSIVAGVAGHLAAWNYFGTIQSPENDAFVQRWNAFNNYTLRPTNDPLASQYLAFNVWVQAVKQAGTTAVDSVRQAAYGQRVIGLTGEEHVMGSNHHMARRAMIGRMRADRAFDVVWQTPDAVAASPWSPFYPFNQGGNWTGDYGFPWLCSRCQTPMSGEPANATMP
eukprot:c46273_g1_i1.p1 GENE.c46273_g1_i1~~c46273_g1_i1.p1  ORF type:complete len:440 (+),score=61.15 c46273_g1_i1:130-1449(+)